VATPLTSRTPTATRGRSPGILIRGSQSTESEHFLAGGHTGLARSAGKAIRKLTDRAPNNLPKCRDHSPEEIFIAGRYDEMSRVLMAVTLGFVLALSSAAPARADDTRTKVPRIIPATLTAQQKADNQTKIKAAKQRAAERRSGGVQAMSGDQGSAFANIYVEPQAAYGFNWCGAGTATVLTAGWQIKTYGYDSIGGYSRYSNPGYGSPQGWYYGGPAFMQHMAYDQDAVQDAGVQGNPGIAEPSRDRTADYSDETHVANAANAETASMRGSFYYAVWQGLGSIGNFDFVMQDTIGAYWVPLSTVTRPCPPGQVCLPGWAGASADMYHWVAVASYDIPNNNITYGDSAGSAQAYLGNDPFGWHYYFTRTTFFYTYMTPYMSGAVVW